jgi:hypothetical protein
MVTATQWSATDDGRRWQDGYQFYAKYFLRQIPPDREMVPVSRAIGPGEILPARWERLYE